MTDELPVNVIPIAPGVSVPERLLSFSFARSSGPGGQNVNKVSSKATLLVPLADLAPHLDGGTLFRLRQIAGRMITEDGWLHITSDESRSQVANKKACIDKLRQLIIQAHARPKHRRKTKPSRGSKERRLESKKIRGDVKKRRSGGFD